MAVRIVLQTDGGTDEWIQVDLITGDRAKIFNLWATMLDRAHRQSDLWAMMLDRAHRQSDLWAKDVATMLDRAQRQSDLWAKDVSEVRERKANAGHRASCPTATHLGDGADCTCDRVGWIARRAVAQSEVRQ